MPKDKRTRKFAQVKRMMKPSDERLKQNQEKKEKKEKEKQAKEGPNYVERTPTALFFQYNEQLGPPYHVIVDTNFINMR